VSRDAPRRYLIAYDVADDRRRARVSTKLSSYGDRLQYSVFIVDGRPAKVVRLRSALARLIDQATDSVIICDLGLLTLDRDRQFDVIGRRRPLTDEHVLVL
jgi:CRISPR-associated protein Cas2